MESRACLSGSPRPPLWPLCLCGEPPEIGFVSHNLPSRERRSPNRHNGRNWVCLYNTPRPPCSAPVGKLALFCIIAPASVDPWVGSGGAIGFVFHFALHTSNLQLSEIGFVWHDGSPRRIGFVWPMPVACSIHHNSFPAKPLPLLTPWQELALFRTIRIGLERWNNGMLEWWGLSACRELGLFGAFALVACRGGAVPRGSVRIGFV
jgi:hypothetical protein